MKAGKVPRLFCVYEENEMYKVPFKRLWLIVLIIPATTACLLFSSVLGRQSATSPARFTTPPSADLTDYTIIYFAPLSPTNTYADVLAADGVRVVTTWQAVVNLVDENTDALIIHHAVLQDIEPTLIRDFYPRSLVLAGINITSAEMVELTGDSRIDNFPVDRVDGFDHFLIVAMRATLDGSSVGNTTELMHDAEGYALFKYLLVDYIQRYRISS
jgi:hypothetical protein